VESEDLLDLDLDTALVRMGYVAFRPGQREAIETLLAARRLLLVAPTGGGKSLTYQLPGTLLRGTTVVISPLIALMNDQAKALERRGVPVTYLSSTLDGGEVRRRMARIAAGQYKIVYVAPERLVFPGFRGLLKDIDIPLVAVDEAHCISEWGHDFRPEYMQIGDLLAELPGPRVLACTATATPVVRDEILARLGLGPDTPQILRGFARPNLILRAAEVMSARERALNVDAQLKEALGAPGSARGVAIVYVPTRLGTEAEAERLAARGWRSTAYHAGLDAASRERAQRAFLDGTVDVITATVAFGMGIDRADVRAVIHLAAPGSIEAYYQEVGRAGRDGEPAWGLVMVSPADMAQRRGLLERGEGVTPETLEHKWHLFLELMRWVEGGSCRHDAILRYFGDEAETLAGCGKCDVCEALAEGDGEQDPEATSLIVRKALSGVARVHARFGLTAAVQLLRGVADPRLVRAELDVTKTFGVLREHAEAWLLKLLRRCVTAGWVDFTAGDRPVVLLTDAGRAVMSGSRPVRLLLPPLVERIRERSAKKKRGRAAAKAVAAVTATPAAQPALPGVARGGKGRAVVDGALDAESERIFEALRELRLELSRHHRLPPYVIAGDRTLREIAQARPRTPGDLAGLFGIGPARVEKYGQAFLDVVAAFL
jgi:ATP-dependent DNA helicase RecQ